MLLMLAEVLHLRQMAENFPDSPIWRFLAHHQSHVQWAGCSLHDLIQPSFSFLVGAALPFSLASRLARGQSVGWMTLHAAWRALLLIWLGIFLRSVKAMHTNFTFEDTLTQIGLGYVPLFVLGLVADRRRWVVWLAFIAILAGYWAAFAVYPLPGSEFDRASVGVSAKWHEEHDYEGFAAHWSKNTNLAWAFDTWFLNLFPRREPFAFNGGGYATLSFLPTLATMILGLFAGCWLREDGRSWRAVGRLVGVGAICMALGVAADHFGICPSVKRIWTPAWTLYSGGWCFFLLAGFYVVMDMAGFQMWAYPLLIIGRNSIAAYMIAHLTEGFIRSTFTIHLRSDNFQYWGPKYEPVVSGAAVLLAYWLILLWMDRRRIFIRI
jgi:predicted acyltransferase